MWIVSCCLGRPPQSTLKRGCAEGVWILRSYFTPTVPFVALTKKKRWRGCWQVMREFVQQPLDENNVCSSSLIALPTCVSSRWAIIPRNGRHPARHCANMPLAELITNFIIMRLGHAQSESGCVQQHAIAPPLITRKSSRHLLLQGLVLVLRG